MIDGALAFAAANQWAVLAVLAVLILLVIVLMAVAVIRASRAPAALPAAPEAPAGNADLDLAAVQPDGDIEAERRERGRTVKRLLREGYAASRETFSRNQYLMPWVLRIGVNGVPDGGMLDAVEEVRPAIGSAAEDNLSWRYFERGVVLDVGTLDAWDDVLAFAADKRPALPVDGVILTVPVEALTDTRRAAAMGAEAYNLLWRAQRQLGFAVPVYVVVSGTEALPGFRAFEEMLPPIHRDGILGWSFPYAMESAFTPEYVAEALQTVEQGMLATTLEAFGSVVTPVAGTEMLRASADLAALEDPLRSFLTTAFRRTAFQEANYFRGLYFITRSDPRAPASFSRDLIERKVLPENGLSKMLRVVSRSRMIRRYAWPAAAAVLALLVVGATVTSLARIDDYRRMVVPILQTTAADVQAMSLPSDDMDAAAAADIAVRYLRNATVLTEEEPLMLLPLTWLGEDPYGVRAAMRAGWQKIVMVSVKRLLEERLDGIAKGETRDVGPQQAFTEYMLRVAEAEGFAVAYNEMARGGADVAVRQMLEYALRLQVPRSTVAKLEAWDAIGADAATIDDPAMRIDVAQYRDAAQAAFRTYADAYFRMLASGGQVGLRLSMVSEELSLLANGARAGGDASTSFAEVLAGLDAAAKMLKEGRPSWLGADGPVVPDEVKPMLEAAAVSTLLGPEARDAARSIAVRRYEEVKGRLVAIDSVIGPLVERHTNGSAALSAPAEGLRQMVRAWSDRRFMQSQAIVDASEPLQGYGYDTTALEAVPPLFDDYLLFEARELSGVPVVLKAALRSAAQNGLYVSVGRALTRAATGLNEDAVAATQSLTRLRDMARSLYTAVPVLEHSIQTFLQIGMTSASDELREHVASLAAAIIQRVDDIVEDDQIYRPSRTYLASWTDGPLDPAALMGQADAAGMMQALTAWRLEIAGLARETAAPMIEVLSRPLLQTPRATALATRWLGVIGSLDAYDGQRPNSSLMRYESFVTEVVPQITTATCMGDLTAPALAGDFFLDRLEVMKTDIRDRCIELADYKLIAGYTALKRFFDQRLAGKQPFAPADADRAAAALGDVREFYALLDKHKDDVVAAIAMVARKRAAWVEPARFVDTMVQAKPLLMAVADTAAGSRLAVQPTFRTNRDYERGGSDIIEWTLTSGSRSVSSFKSGESVVWLPGDPVRVSLRWAKNAPVIPWQTVGPAGAGADGKTAEFVADGTWSLFALLRRLEPPVSDLGVRAEPGRVVARMDVVTAPRPRPAQDGEEGETSTVQGGDVIAWTAPAPSDRPPTPGVVRADTTVFAQFTLKRQSEADGKPVEETVPYPHLPVIAPDLPDRRPSQAPSPYAALRGDGTMTPVTIDPALIDRELMELRPDGAVMPLTMQAPASVPAPVPVQSPAPRQPTSLLPLRASGAGGLNKLNWE